ncbi:MAG TPA: alkane 1-monooxygenase [Aeromicrobium sp.]|nr:alkane 1-monooxygenase [Aeromicrobium sp.]
MYKVVAASGESVTWRDPKRYYWLFSGLIPMLGLTSWALWAWTHWTPVWYWGAFLFFVLIPILDLVMGTDPSNPPDEVLDALEKDRYYRWVTYLFIPLQILLFLWAAYLLGGGTLPGIDDPLTWTQKLGLAISVGLLAGVGINTAHELGHKKEKVERWYARVALAQTAYGHFYIEHNRGHHVRVATPPDPASSRLGETIFEFLPRTVIGSFRSAWNLERTRLNRRGQSHWSLRNDLFNAWVFTPILWGAAIVMNALLGLQTWQILPFLVVQAIIGIGLLETVNYLEHYGMRRQLLDSGRYERINASHSWNSNNVATNILLYHLQRHSDHHANPTRRYQALRDFKEAPVLPTGYAGMIVLAWLTPLWRRVMDPKVVAHYDGDLNRANVHPRTAERYFVRYSEKSQSTNNQA